MVSTSHLLARLSPAPFNWLWTQLSSPFASVRYQNSMLGTGATTKKKQQRGSGSILNILDYLRTGLQTHSTEQMVKLKLSDWPIRASGQQSPLWHMRNTSGIRWIKAEKKRMHENTRAIKMAKMGRLEETNIKSQGGEGETGLSLPQWNLSRTSMPCCPLCGPPSSIKHVHSAFWA